MPRPHSDPMCVLHAAAYFIRCRGIFKAVGPCFNSLLPLRSVGRAPRAYRRPPVGASDESFQTIPLPSHTTAWRRKRVEVRSYAPMRGELG